MKKYRTIQAGQKYRSTDSRRVATITVEDVIDPYGKDTEPYAVTKSWDPVSGKTKTTAIKVRRLGDSRYYKFLEQK